MLRRVFGPVLSLHYRLLSRAIFSSTSLSTVSVQLKKLLTRMQNLIHICSPQRVPHLTHEFTPHKELEETMIPISQPRTDLNLHLHGKSEDHIPDRLSTSKIRIMDLNKTSSFRITDRQLATKFKSCRVWLCSTI